MAARAYWKGFLRLSLVSVRVEAFNAASRTIKCLQIANGAQISGTAGFAIGW